MFGSEVKCHWIIVTAFDLAVTHFIPRLNPHSTQLLLFDLVIFWGVFEQPRSFNLSDISNKGLIARLYYLVENDPVCFPVLLTNVSERPHIIEVKDN
jgi:hypothetical protein